MANRKLIVEIVGDARQLERTFGRASNASRGFASGLQRDVAGIQASTSKLDKLSLTKGIFAGVAASEGIRALRAAVDVASNLNEQTARTGEIFENSARSVQRWADTTSRAFGVAEDRALEAAGTFGQLFRTVGSAPEQAARLSQSLVQLAADLASFNNTSVDDALQALRSGLTGEIEPLRRFGVFLSDARVKQEALAASGKKTSTALTDQEKVLARYNLILQDTNLAQGDFERTSGSLANQQRTLAAQARDLQGAIGSALVPALTDAVEVLNLGAEAARRFGDALNGITGSGGDQGGGLFGLDGLKLSDLFVLPGVKLAADLARALQPDQLPQLNTVDLSLGSKPFAGLGAGQFKIPTNLVIGSPADTQLQALRAQLTETLADDLEALRNIAAQAKQKLDASKPGTEKYRKALTDFVNASSAVKGVQDQIAADNEQAAAVARQNAEEARRKAAAGAARLRESIAESNEASERLAEAQRQRWRDTTVAVNAILERLPRLQQERQFRALGLTSTGGTVPPAAKALQSQLATLEKAVEGSFLDTKKTQGLFGRIRSVFGDGMGALTLDTRTAIANMLDDIRRQLGDASTSDEFTKFQKTSTRQLVAGLGLTRDQTNALRGRLSQIGANGTINTSNAVGAFGIPVGTTTINTTVELDGAVVGRSLTKHQQKSSARTTGQRGEASRIRNG